MPFEASIYEITFARCVTNTMGGPPVYLDESYMRFVNGMRLSLHQTLDHCLLKCYSNVKFKETFMNVKINFHFQPSIGFILHYLISKLLKKECKKWRVFTEKAGKDRNK